MLRVDIVKQRGDFTLRVKFAAPTPGIVALFGRSGCGKTTLIDVLAGLLPPDDGHASLDGLDLSMPAERRRIGYVFQDARLFPHYDVRGNLRYGEKRATHGASQPIGFDEVVSLLGLEALLERRPSSLSGGERQRVALGRALLSNPRLLLLDEPLAPLDAARREEVMPYLEALRDRLSIPMVYVSHQLDEVLRLATHVVLLEAGVLVAQGSPREVSLQPQLQSIVGREAVGAVVEGTVTAMDTRRQLADLSFEGGKLHVQAHGLHVGSKARVQVLARDVILSIEAPRGLSVRNALEGRIDAIAAESADASLLRVAIGQASVLARVTQDAIDALQLHTGRKVWVLVKAVSARAFAFP
jgi:molybdate transport system ATP-binding protein